MPPNVIAFVKSEVGLESVYRYQVPVPKRHASNDTKCDLPM